MDFIIDEVIKMNFIIKEESTSKYATAETTGEVSIDSTMNYLRYKRIDEIIGETIDNLSVKTIKEITEEEG